MAESAEKKAHRLLTEGRLVVKRVDDGGELPWVMAECRGFTDGELYHLGYDPGKNEWRCTCQASATFHRRCSHLIALQLVVRKPVRG